MSQWATSPKSVQNREEEQNARHGREPWDSRVLQELPCVPVPRANRMNAAPGYVPGTTDGDARVPVTLSLYRSRKKTAEASSLHFRLPLTPPCYAVRKLSCQLRSTANSNA